MNIAELGRNADFEWATRLNRIMLTFVGIWPSEHKNVHGKFLSDVRVMFTVIIIILMGVIPLIHSLIETWGDLLLTTDNLQFTISFVIAIAKLVTVWWKETDLLMLINMIADDWTRKKTDRERCVMVRQARNARILSMAGYCIMILGIVFLIILPCFGRSVRYVTNVTDPIKILPFPTQYVYDKNRSPYFEFTYVAQIFVLLTAAATYSGVDNLLGLLIFHLCGQLENLKEKLINIRQFVSYNDGVAFVVKEHIRLVKCFHVIESTYTLLLLGLLVYFGVLFSMYGFLVVEVLKEGRKMSTMRFFFLVSTALNIAGHMCLFCAVGEILIAKCDAIYSAAYQHEWYEIKPRKARTMVLILIRANKPFYVTAGKMFPMTMSMFCNLIKTSAGYISVLLAMKT